MKTFTVNGYTAAIKHDDAMMQKFGVPSFLPCAMIDNTPEGPVIYISSGFYSLTTKTQNAIYTHEIGHLALGHLDKTDSDVLTINETLEAEADLWACNIVGEEAFDKAIFETVAVTLDELALAGYELTTTVRESARLERDTRIANRKKLAI